MWQRILAIVRSDTPMVWSGVRWVRNWNCRDTRLVLRFARINCAAYTDAVNGYDYTENPCGVCGDITYIYPVGDIDETTKINCCDNCTTYILMIVRYFTMKSDLQYRKMIRIGDRLLLATLDTYVIAEPICSNLNQHCIAYLRMMLYLKSRTCYDVARSVITLICELVVHHSSISMARIGK